MVVQLAGHCTILAFRRCIFNSQSNSRCIKTLGKFSHTLLRLSPSSINWYQQKQEAEQALHVMHWPIVHGLAALVGAWLRDIESGNQHHCCLAITFFKAWPNATIQKNTKNLTFDKSDFGIYKRLNFKLCMWKACSGNSMSILFFIIFFISILPKSTKIWFLHRRGFTCMPACKPAAVTSDDLSVYLLEGMRYDRCPIAPVLYVMWLILKTCCNSFTPYPDWPKFAYQFSFLSYSDSAALLHTVF